MSDKPGHSNAVPVLYQDRHFPTRKAFVSHLAAELRIKTTVIGATLYQHGWDIDAAIKELKANPPSPIPPSIVYRGQRYISKAAFRRFLESRGMEWQHANDIASGVSSEEDTDEFVDRYCAAFALTHLLPPPPAPEPPTPAPEPLSKRQCVVWVPEHCYDDIQLMAKFLLAQPHLTIALIDPKTGRVCKFGTF